MNDGNDGKIIRFPKFTGDRGSKKRWADFKWNTSSAIVGAVVASLILTLLAAIGGFFKLPGRVEEAEDGIHNITETTIPNLKGDLNEQIEGINEDITGINEELLEIQDDLKDSVEHLDSRLDNLYSVLFKNLNLKASEEYTKQLAAGMGSKDSMPQDTAPTIAHVVACTDDGTEYTSDELADINLVLPYRDGEKNGYFYGRFNENNHWDGNCIVNIYQQGKLELITDANYEDGRLRYCRQVFPDTTTNGQPIWVISNRIVEGNTSHGETWHFFRNDDFFEIQEPKSVGANDIISVDQFNESLHSGHSGVEGYYSGIVSDGKFNDTSGKAYMIKYFEDGLIRTLYVGAFKDGLFHDESGNAWMIGKVKNTQESYAYYKGPFRNGQYTGGTACWKDPISQSEIDKIMEESGIIIDNRFLIWHHPNV